MESESRSDLDESLTADLEKLQQLEPKELKVLFRELFGIPSPSCNHAHLSRRLCWHLQAKSRGPLSERALARAFQLTAEGYARLPVPKGDHQLRHEQTLSKGKDLRLPRVGTVLERSYQGQLATVTVLENGFESNGKVFASLSAIASRVTGTRWNGFHFFGLKSPWITPGSSDSQETAD